MPDLFPDDRARLPLDPGAVLLGGFALPVERVLLQLITHAAEAAPFRHLDDPVLARPRDDSAVQRHAGSRHRETGAWRFASEI